MYEVDEENRDSIIDHINSDFAKLGAWDNEWNVTLVADKTQAMVISKMKSAFDIYQINY